VTAVDAGRTADFLVVSDSHGDADALARVFSWAGRKGIGTVAFLGDGVRDLDRAADRSGFRFFYRTVRGNGDDDPSLPFQRSVDFAGRRFLLAHGHAHGVLDGLDSLAFAARAANAEAALFGHTHIPFSAEYRGLLFLNPGSLSRPRGGSEPSFAVVTCPVSGEGPLSVRHWRLDAAGAVREYRIDK